jgi:hypothetical protein
MKKGVSDPVMRKVQEAFEKSNLTLDDLGQRMGYAENIARKSAWQFLHRTNDPRLSMLRKFAVAVGVELKDLVS